MSAVSNLAGAPLRRAPLTAALAAGVVLVVAPLCAAVVNPWRAAPAGTTEVAPADNAGLNVLEPADKLVAPVATVQAPKANDVERTIGEWNPTGGGGGGGGSPGG